MVAHVSTVACQGVEARAVDVQVHMASGLPSFAIAVRAKPLTYNMLLRPEPCA